MIAMLGALGACRRALTPRTLLLEVAERVGLGALVFVLVPMDVESRLDTNRKGFPSV